jgi:hypothetical protein
MRHPDLALMNSLERESPRLLKYDWVVANILSDAQLVFILFRFFFLENIAIGNFTRKRSRSDGGLIENAFLWLLSSDGAVLFISRHNARLTQLVRQKFSEDDFMRVRQEAQIPLFFERRHCELVRSGCDHDPTDEELAGDELLQFCYSLRLFLIFLGPKEYFGRVLLEYRKLSEGAKEKLNGILEKVGVKSLEEGN